MPIKPDEVVAKKKQLTPPEVFEVFDELIAEYWNNGRSSFSRTTAKNKIMTKITNKRFDYNWLNVEDIYRQAGWKVEYKTPSYDESYDSYYTFSKN